MKETFRWYGVKDTVSLQDIKQTGATGVVTALHHVQNGAVWEVEEIRKVKNAVEEAGLEWTFIESIPIHENIKLRRGDYLERIENYKQSIINVAQCGIKYVCYNFMPVLDWTRTHLFWELQDGSTALRFDKVDMAVFECHIIALEGSEASYSEAILKKAKNRFASMTPEEKQRLEDGVLKGLPGTVDDLTIPVFKDMIAQYEGVTHEDLKANLSYFLNEVIPVAEAHGVKMAIHPDDPPFDIMGLPRIVKSEADLEDLLNFIDSPSNGITFCTGSLGANPENDLPRMIEKFGDRIHFLHLRNVKREHDGSFYEDNHLEGSSDMYEIVKAVLKVENRRGISIPMRPDHGHQMLDDLKKEEIPGYSAIGRLRGLAEIRGLAMGIKRSLDL
ncbi:mannonate dehydratase [Snuella sedimenti]|uniref:Mannonate dehydratase n=1 Tax=Snuella sedimenti TaxID=2798802 RepID=A0A8J7J1R9_9FLAO|nr:mannonate dehydratase [Snuella sedimenti]MBJ6367439.1 mannonate dehydratase [Snuella sedimenti]